MDDGARSATPSIPPPTRVSTAQSPIGETTTQSTLDIDIRYRRSYYEFKHYPAPAAKTHKNPGAYGIAVAGDGSVWWAEAEADLMARADRVTGKVEEYKIPYDGHAYPRRIGADANGDLWVGLWNAGRLMKVDHKSCAQGKLKTAKVQFFNAIFQVY